MNNVMDPRGELLVRRCDHVTGEADVTRSAVLFVSPATRAAVLRREWQDVGMRHGDQPHCLQRSGAPSRTVR